MYVCSLMGILRTLKKSAVDTETKSYQDKYYMSKTSTYHKTRALYHKEGRMQYHFDQLLQCGRIDARRFWYPWEGRIE